MATSLGKREGWPFSFYRGDNMEDETEALRRELAEKDRLIKKLQAELRALEKENDSYAKALKLQ